MSQPVSPQRAAGAPVAGAPVTVAEDEFFLRIEPADPSRFRQDLLFFHGYGQTRAELLPLGVALARQGYRVLAPDLPGHGPGTTELTAGALLELAAQARARAGEHAWVAGFSLGARVAMSLSADKCLAISPPLPARFEGEAREELLAALRPRWVREESPMGGLSEALERLERAEIRARRLFLIQAQRDLACVREGVARWRTHGACAGRAMAIPRCDHGSILVSPELPPIALEWLQR